MEPARATDLAVPLLAERGRSSSAEVGEVSAAEASCDIGVGASATGAAGPPRAGVVVQEVGQAPRGFGDSSSDDDDPKARRKQVHVVVQEAPAGFADSSSDDDCPKSLHRKPRVVVQEVGTREWGELDSSSSDEELEAMTRHQRYAQLVKEIEQGVKQAQAVSSDDHEPEVWHHRFRATLLCLFCCFFFCFHNLVNGALALRAAYGSDWLAVACLAPQAAFLAVLEVGLAWTDRGVVLSRSDLRGRVGFVGTLAFDALVLVGLGLLHGYRLYRAISHVTTNGVQHYFLTELEALDPSRKLLASGPRWDSHYMLWGVPNIIFAVLFLPLYWQSSSWWLWLALFVVSSPSVLVAALHFDDSASQHIRTHNGLMFDQFRWVRESNAGQQLFRRRHACFRLSEMVGRLAVIGSAALVVRSHPCAVAAVGLFDYALGLTALCIVSGSSMEAVALSVPIVLLDIGRFVDEPGFVVPARKLSRTLDVLRGAEAILALACCLCVAATGTQALKVAAASLLALMLFAYGVYAQLRFCMQLQHGSDDVFVAVLCKDARAVLKSLSFEGGCTPGMRICDPTRRTALHLASDIGALDCVTLLLESSADPRVSDARGECPLHAACRRGNVAVAKLLLHPPPSNSDGPGARPADVMQGDVKGVVPADVVPKGAPMEMQELLGEASARQHHRPRRSRHSVRKRTAARYAEYSKNLFGDVVGGEHLHVWVGPREQRGRAELASLMVSKAMGDQLGRLAEHARQVKSGDRIRMSNLEIMTTLGAGSFGKVMKVRDAESGEFYAMKLQSKDKSVKQAVREAEALRDHKHPFIVDLVHIFHTPTYYGILMEFCEKDLNSCILEHIGPDERASGLPTSLVARYTACLMLALENLHIKRVVFRDLKPENVLVSAPARGNHAKLTDFGLARIVPAMDEEDAGAAVGHTMTARAGTPAFMSSESFSSSATSIASSDASGDAGTASANMDFGWYASRDWYGLGCCLILMLLGEGGGRRISAGRRDVLLPAKQGDILDLLMNALDAEFLDEDTFDLVSSLTAERVQERANSDVMRASALLQPAIAELEQWIEAGAGGPKAFRQ